MKNKFGKILACAFAFLLLFVCVVPAAASSEFTTCDGKVKVANGNEGTLTTSDGGFTATATGAKRSSTQTNTITITNNTSATAEIGFTWSATKSNYRGSATATVNGKSNDLSMSTATTGSVTVSLNANESITVQLYAKGAQSKENTATMNLTNFTWRELKSDYTVKVQSNGNGSIKVNGADAASGSVYSMSASEASTLTATAGSGATFLGWRNADTGALFGTNATLSFTPVEDFTLEAVFISNAAPQAWFQVEDKYMFSDLNAANSAAVSGNKIILMNTGTLGAGNYTIKSGVTLLIPFDSNNTCYTTTPEIYDMSTETLSNANNTKAFRTLTLADGSHITVNGAISVSAKAITTGGSGASHGTPYGYYGAIDMISGSTITLNNGAFLYAWGYITGDGKVIAESGSTVYEYFQMTEFRGGTSLSANYFEGFLGALEGDLHKKKVFPLSQYYIQNILTEFEIKSGGSVHCYTALYVSGSVTNASVKNVIGKSECLFNITSGSLTRRYDKTTDRITYSINGEASLGSLSLIIGTPVDSSDYALPLSNNMTFRITSGSTFAVNNDVAMLPGSKLIIDEGATVTIASDKNCYVYDSEQWGAYCWPNAKFIALSYIPGRTYTRTEADLVDAEILVNGTLNASAGYLYTTSSGANIHSTGNGTVKIEKGSSTNTYQAEGNATAKEIPITSAQLKHGENSYGYLSTADGGDGTYKYSSEHKRWVKDGHTVTSTTEKEASCTETGTAKHTCTCGWENEAPIDALGHVDENADGKCDRCENAFIEFYGASLLFEDDIQVKFYVKAVLFTQDKLENAGLEVFGSADATTPLYTVDGLTKSESYYYALSHSIAAKNMGDSMFYRAYVVYNGTTYYSEIKEYSPQKYCKNKITNSDTHESLRALCIALMNYGAEAQKYFAATTDYTYDALMNTFLTDEQRKWDYSDNMIIPTKTLTLSGLTVDSSKVKMVGGSVLMTGALKIKVYFDAPENADVKIYYWTNSGESLVLSNAKTSEVYKTSNTSTLERRYCAYIEGIAAKNMGDTVSVCAAVTIDGVTYYTEVLNYSIHRYAGNMISKNGNMVDLAKTLVIYSNAAKTHFAS